MKKLLLIALALSFAASALHAQAPQGFNYQAVVRNNSGQIISNREVNMRLNIVQGSEDGPSVYLYMGHVQTNQNGIITLVVGENSPTYAAINWSNGPYFLKSEIDINNGNDFALSTVQQIMSVPYAEFAAVADHVSTSFTYNEQDPRFCNWGYLYDSLVNAPTRLSQFINDLSQLSASDIQLSLSGDTLFISGGNYVILPKDIFPTTMPWDSITGHPTYLSQFVNDLGLSDFYNDLNLSDFNNDITFTVSGDTLFFGDNFVTINSSTSISWDSITGRPTTIAWDSITGRPTTIAWDSITGRPTTIAWDSITGRPTTIAWDSITGRPTTIAWDSITGRPRRLSQFVNDLNLSDFYNDLGLSDFYNDLTFTISGDTLFYGTNRFVVLPQNALSTIDWSNVSNRPTSLSDFLNDMGFVTAESQNLQDVLGMGNYAGNRITGLSSPQGDNDAVNKHYADSVYTAMQTTLLARIDSLKNVVDTLTARLTQSMTHNDSLNVTIDSLVHPTTPGLLPGRFSISPYRQIQFSQGNLQYMPRIKIFRFAPSQYDIGSHTNINNGELCDNWIDLFPFGTSGWAGGRMHYMPYETSTLDNQYIITTIGDGNLTGESANGDWGIYNPIINGGNQMATWRTLTGNEWAYILGGRNNATQLKTLATVNGRKGLILLPDEWAGTSINMTITTSSYETNNYNTSDWETLEAEGAVFLPSAGWREGPTVYGTSNTGFYWSTTRTPGQDQGSAVNIAPGTGAIATPTACSRGCSVRLVRDY